MTNDVTVVCVLRLGGPVYTDLSWARKLRHGVQTFLPEAKFVCLTNDPIGSPLLHDGQHQEYQPLAHPEWSGFWSLVNWWQPGRFTGRVLAVGLDTLFVGDASEIAAYDGPVAGIHDFYHPGTLASGVMSWTGDECAPLYHEFEEFGNAIRDHHGRMDPWMRRRLLHAEKLQDHFPNQIVSLKAHCANGIPKNARIVCGHGQPRLNSPRAGWAYDYWRNQ